MHCGHPRLCLSVCLSAATRAHYCTDPDVTWVCGRDCPLVCTIGRIYNRCTGFVAVPPKLESAFPSQTRQIKNIHVVETTASIPTKFCTVVKTTKFPSWVVQTSASQIQDGGKPPYCKNGKSYLRESLTDRQEIRHDNAV